MGLILPELKKYASPFYPAIASPNPWGQDIISERFLLPIVLMPIFK